MIPEQLINSSTLKERLGAVEKSLTDVRNDVQRSKKRYNQLVTEKLEIETRLHSLNTALKAPRISDHAMLRYLERKLGIDVETLRNELLDDNLLTAMKMNATKVTRDGVDFIIRDQTVVTVIT